jgi:hypothetical protein
LEIEVAQESSEEENASNVLDAKEEKSRGMY